MNIISVGNPPYTEIGFVYSTEYSTPTILDNKAYWEGFYGAGKIGGRLEGFSSEKATYIRAYATNSRGTVYGETIQLFSPDFIVIPELGIAVQREDIGYGNWNSMNTLCENSTVGGFTDWRLPTIDELAALYNLRDKIGGFTTERNYWSSTKYSSYSYYYIYFSNGYRSDKSSNGSCGARAVRTLTE